MRRRIAVLGGGAWGTALANTLALNGCETTLWSRDVTQTNAMAATRQNAGRLPGVTLAASLSFASGAIPPAACYLLATPAQSLRAVLGAARPDLTRDAPLVLCAKGIEQESGLFLSEVARQSAPGHAVAVLSGPSFAHDLAARLPTAVTLAAEDGALARELATQLGAPWFRIYHTDDLRGVEIGGAAKNVLAIACGVAAGKRLGASAVAALTARGFAELSRFGRACGARPETLAGLSGLGDLVLTCSSAQSRNFAYGEALGRGETLPAGTLREGALTAPVLVEKARALDVDMPIAATVADLVAGRVSVADVANRLLSRPQRAEDERQSR